MAMKIKEVFALARATAAVEANEQAAEALNKVIEAYSDSQLAKAAHKEAGKKTAQESKDKRDSLLVEMKAYSIRCWADNIPAANASAALRYKLTEMEAPIGTVKNYGSLVAGAVTGLGNGRITPDALETFTQKQWQDACASDETRAKKAALDMILEAWKEHAETFETADAVTQAAMMLAECIKGGSYMDAALADELADDTDAEEKQAA